MKQDWKKAQDKVKKALKLYESSRKDFWVNEPVDTYKAGNIVQEQPADLLLLYRGVFGILEVKSSHYTDKFYFKDVRPVQFAACRRVTAAGGMSAFILAKLPDWEWYMVAGTDFYLAKEAGAVGMYWHEMTKLKTLDATTILTFMQITHGKGL